MRMLSGVLIAVSLLVAVSDAAGSFPGRNGRLVVTGCHAVAGDELNRWRATFTTLRADGTRRRVIRTFAPVPPQDRCLANTARWSADGELLLYTHGGGVFLADARGRDIRAVLPDYAHAGGWAPDGRRIVAPISRGFSQDAWALAVVAAGRTHRVPVSYRVRERTGWYRDVFDPAWRPTGRYVAFSRVDLDAVLVPEPRFRVCRVDLLRRRERCLARGMRPEYSPDGSRIAFLRDGEVWTMRGDGSRQRRLTRLHERRGRPAPVNAAWSPDGRLIAYVARESAWEATGELRVVGADGRGDRRIASGDRLGRLGTVDWQPR